MLEIRHVTVSYGGERPALADFSLHLEPGEVVAVVGESGCGKTTAVRAVLGLLPPGGRIIRGEIRWEGKDLADLTGEEWRKLRGEQMAAIFQDAGAMLNPIRTIGGQFVELIRAHRNTAKAAARTQAAQMLVQMGLPDAEGILRSYPFQLSGGQRQRVGIAMAMAFQPRLLLADEPTSALDVTTQAQIVRQMADLRREFQTAILLVTHHLGVASYLADRILVMRQGQVVEEGRRPDFFGDTASSYTRELLAASPDMEGERYV